MEAGLDYEGSRPRRLCYRLAVDVRTDWMHRELSIRDDQDKYSRVSDNEYSRETPEVDSLWGIFVTGGWFGVEAPIWERVLHGQLDSLSEIFATSDVRESYFNRIAFT